MPAHRAVLFLAFLFLPALAQAGAPESVTFKAADGVEVYGDLYRPNGTPHGVLLLFHQAQSDRVEYAPIAPKLAALGWIAMAIDQRSGGSYFGGQNLTAAGVGRDPGYLAALPDLEAALAYSRVQFPPFRPVVWGSSYSASLVFLLAVRHPADVSAVLAFSPGEYFAGASVRAAAAKITVPIYVTSASDPEEEAAAAAIIASGPAVNRHQTRAKVGVHGSATLRADSNPLGAAANFAAVTAWLATLP